MEIEKIILGYIYINNSVTSYHNYMNVVYGVGIIIVLLKKEYIIELF